MRSSQTLYSFMITPSVFPNYIHPMTEIILIATVTVKAIAITIIVHGQNYCEYNEYYNVMCMYDCTTKL